MEIKDLNNWYKVASQHDILTEDLTFNYENSIKGQKGEDEFNKWVNDYMSCDYLIFRNIWLSTGGSRVEIDHLILTPNYWIATEVKNYEKNFYYKDGVSKIGNKVLDTNIITRAESSYRVLEEIAGKLKHKPKVISNIVFINEHCRAVVDYNGPVNIMMRCDLRDFLEEMDQKTLGYPVYDFEDEIVQHIKRFETRVSFAFPTDDELRWDKLKTGVFCPRCGGADVEDRHLHYVCSNCKKKELKRDTILRAVNNYCVLYRKDEFTVAEIFEFLDGEISRSTISKLVNDVYLKSADSKAKYYKFESKYK